MLVIQFWYSTDKLSLNTNKTKHIKNERKIEQDTYKYLDEQYPSYHNTYFSNENLPWKQHVANLNSKLSPI